MGVALVLLLPLLLAVPPHSVRAVAGGGGGGGGGGAALVAAHADASPLRHVEDVHLDADPTAASAAEPRAPQADVSTAAGREEVLLSLPEPDPELVAAARSHLPRHQRDDVVNRLWARRQAELQEALASVKTDADFMSDLLSQLLGAAGDTDAQCRTLQDLEFLAANGDNAVDLHALGGLAAVVPLLNASAPAVATDAAWLLGTVVKAHPTLQEAAVELGALRVLVSALLRATHDTAHDGTGDGSHSLLVARQAYALASLLRVSPVAQRALVASGDAPALFHALLLSPVAGVARKALALLGDLAVEGRADVAAPRASGAGPDGGPAIVVMNAAGDAPGEDKGADQVGQASVLVHTLLPADAHDDMAALCRAAVDAAVRVGVDARDADASEKALEALARLFGASQVGARSFCAASGGAARQQVRLAVQRLAAFVQVRAAEVGDPGAAAAAASAVLRSVAG